jgi:hypothetical protein
LGLHRPGPASLDWVTPSCAGRSNRLPNAGQCLHAQGKRGIVSIGSLKTESQWLIFVSMLSLLLRCLERCCFSIASHPTVRKKSVSGGDRSAAGTSTSPSAPSSRPVSQKIPIIAQNDSRLATVTAASVAMAYPKARSIMFIRKLLVSLAKLEQGAGSVLTLRFVQGVPLVHLNSIKNLKWRRL